MNTAGLARFGGTPVLSATEQEQAVGRWPDVHPEDVDAVMRVLNADREPWGFLHPEVLEFEKDYARHVDRAFCLAVSSGTAALHLALAALDLQPGAHVLTPALGYIASAACALHHNCIPIFVDVDDRTFNIDPVAIEERITPETAAIIAVDLLGLPADYDAINTIARRHGLPVISDASQSQGGAYRGRRTGGLGDVSAISIMASKNLPTCGEGGIVATDDEVVARNLLGHASLGMRVLDSGGPRRVSYELGFNYRPTPTSIAFARRQLQRLEAYQQAREERVALFSSQISAIPLFQLPHVPQGSRHAWQMVRILLHTEALELPVEDAVHVRDALIFLARAEGAVCGLWEERTLPEMPLFQERVGYGGGCPWTCNGREPPLT